MDKSELIAALRETGIVSKENDANGVRVLLTLNDFEKMGEKKDKSLLEKRVRLAQFWGILITSGCLILTTVWGMSSSRNEVRYISKSGYVLKLTDNFEDRCLIPDSKETGYRLSDLTGVPLCK